MLSVAKNVSPSFALLEIFTFFSRTLKMKIGLSHALGTYLESLSRQKNFRKCTVYQKRLIQFREIEKIFIFRPFKKWKSKIGLSHALGSIHQEKKKIWQCIVLPKTPRPAVCVVSPKTPRPVNLESRQTKYVWDENQESSRLNRFLLSQ